MRLLETVLLLANGPLRGNGRACASRGRYPHLVSPVSLERCSPPPPFRRVDDLAVRAESKSSLPGTRRYTAGHPRSETMKSIDIVYRYSAIDAAARPRPGDAEAALKRLDDGGQMIAELCADAAEGDGTA